MNFKITFNTCVPRQISMWYNVTVARYDLLVSFNSYVYSLK